MMKDKKTIFLVLVVVLVVAVGSFFVGMKYQESKRPQFRFGNFQQREMAQFDQRQWVRPVSGEIIGVDEKGITLKFTDNSSNIIFLTEATSINKTSEGSKEDLKVGEKVIVFGIKNSDGSLTAQNIQINPILRGIPTERLQDN